MSRPPSRARCAANRRVRPAPAGERAREAKPSIRRRPLWRPLAARGARGGRRSPHPLPSRLAGPECTCRQPRRPAEGRPPPPRRWRVGGAAQALRKWLSGREARRSPGDDARIFRGKALPWAETVTQRRAATGSVEAGRGSGSPAVTMGRRGRSTTATLARISGVARNANGGTVSPPKAAPSSMATTGLT